MKLTSPSDPSSTNKASSASQFRQVYESEHDKWTQVAARLGALIADEMERLNLDVLVQARAKTPGSFERKVRRIIRERASFDYAKSIEDLAAVRIITHDRHDKEQAIAGFKNLLRARGARTLEASTAEREHQLWPWEFAYRSHHLSFQLSEEFFDDSDCWSVSRGRWIELQVRTVAEHAWAAIDHEYRYKSIAPLSSRATRILFMLSAQLEAIDFQLENLRGMVLADLGPDGERLRAGDANVEINSANVQLMLSAREPIQHLLGRARDAGWDLPEPVQVDTTQPSSRSNLERPRIYTADELSAAESELAAASQLADIAEKLELTSIAELEQSCLEAVTEAMLGHLAVAADHHHLDRGLYPADLLGVALVAKSPALDLSTYERWAHALADVRRSLMKVNAKHPVDGQTTKSVDP